MRYRYDDDDDDDYKTPREKVLYHIHYYVMFGFFLMVIFGPYVYWLGGELIDYLAK